MDKREVRRGLFREIVEKGRGRFGDDGWTERMGRALVRGRRVVVRSGNGVGKTFLAADLTLWFLMTHRPSIVITTAPTERQMRMILWREIRKRCYKLGKRLPAKVLQTRIELADGSCAYGFAADKGVTFQGAHCENLLIILDEASGVPDEIWDAAEGVAVGDNNKILAIGNPLRATGRFYQTFTRANGWKRFTISALQHPNVTGTGKMIPGCVTAMQVDALVEQWCEEQGLASPVSDIEKDPTLQNSDPPTLPDAFTWRRKRYAPNDLFRARVLGEFPRAEEDGLIPLAWIEAAVARSLPALGCKRAAVDVARQGSDSTVLGVRVGPVLTRMDVIRGADTNEVTGAVKRLAYSEHPSSIAIDAIGIGAGIVDRLRDERISGVIAVNVCEAAYCPESFANRRAELYWGLRERFRLGDIQIKDDALLIEELASIRYHLNARGQIQIEDKEKMKQRLRRSPDRADMLMMLFDALGDRTHVWPRITLPSPEAILRK